MSSTVQKKVFVTFGGHNHKSEQYILLGGSEREIFGLC